MSQRAEEAFSNNQNSDADPNGEAQGHVVTCTSLAAWFKDAIGQACENQGFDATDTSQYYVVNLLSSFAESDQLYVQSEDGRRRLQALASMLADAMEATPSERIGHYRRMGDTALFVSGVFSDSLKRRPIDTTYYVEMGRGAYASLSGLLRRKDGQVFRELYVELADTFGDWVEVLREVSEEANLSTPPERQDTDELYERWSRTRGTRRAQRLATAMIGRGVLPGW